MFKLLPALKVLWLNNNALGTLPDNVFDRLTSLITLNLWGNPGPDGDTTTDDFAPEAVALPDGGTVSTGGTVTLDGSGSDGGPWGTNVTYGWELTDPASGVTVMFDDDTSVTPEVTIPVLPADAELTFTLTVTGRGGIFGTAPGTDTATVTVTASADATLESLTVNDGTSDLTLAPAFASGTFDYTAQVGKAVTTVTLTAMTTDESATVDAVTLNGTAIADSDFTDGITVPSLLAGDNAIVETVRAEDTSTTQTYTVTVTREANAAPTAIDGLVTTNEDTAHTFAAAEFSFADADAGDALVRVTVVTPPAAGELALGGAAVTADQEVSAADIGQLVFTPASNAHGQDYASFTFKVSDGVDASALDYTMTVNVTAVNDPATGAPTIYGTAWVGRTPAVGTTGIEDVDGLTSPTYGYQWVRVDADGASNPTDITGETSDTYTLVEADVGKKLKVRVSFTDDGGNAETLTSDAYPSSGTIEVAPGICGRTAEVRNAIVHITDVSDCADVTAEHLAAITGTLHLSAQNITALRAGDFDGLTSLEELHLTHNELTTLPDGVFAGLTALTELRLDHNNRLTRLDGNVFDELTALATLDLNNNQMTELPDDVFAGLNALTVLHLSHNELRMLPDGVFKPLTELTDLFLYNNKLGTLPDGVFEPLTELTTLHLAGNPGANYRPVAVALPDGETVSNTGGTVTLDGSGSDGGPWGTNVTYGWELTDPASGVTVMFDDDASVTSAVTITELAADAELTFTLTVTGRGGTDGIAPGTDTATVTVTASADATLESLTVNDGTSDLPLAPAFASGTHVYTAEVGKAVTTVTLTAMTTDSDATVTAVTLNGTRIADSDFTDGIEVPSLLAGENGIVVTVRAEDTSTTQTYTVTVTREANTAPTAINSSVTTDEDTPHTFATTEFSFADDAGDALVRVTVVTPPAAGELALGGAAVTADQEVSAADIGQLVFTPASNAHGQDYASFTFKVSDGFDESDSAYTMTVHVTAVNDAATGAPGISGTAQVGEQLTAGQGDIDDIDGLPTAFPGDYSFQWVRVDADGISNPTDISGETGSTYTPADADVGKKLQVKVSFMDDDNNFEELTSEAYPASGTVEAAPNVAPAFSSSETFDVAENQTAVGTVQATDDDDDVTGYTIEGGADLALFVIDLTSGDLAFRAAPNHEAAADADGNNTYVVDVRATSGAGIRTKTTDQTITVTVTDVDEPPGAPFAPTVSSVSVVSVTAIWVAPSNAGPAIEDYDYRSRVKDSVDSWVEVKDTTITALRATIDGLAENTEYEVAVRATNEEGMSEWSEAGFGSTDANAPPVFSSSATFDVAENQTAVGAVQATDEDDEVTGYAIRGDRSRFAIGAGTGDLTFKSAPNYEAPTDADRNNIYVVDVRATSGAGIREKTTDQTITVTVTDVEKPGVPGAPTVSSASVDSVRVIWVEPSNEGPEIEDYDYRYRVKDDPQGSWMEVTDTTSTALRATIEGLAENTEYEVQVRATNAEGTSEWSEAGSGTATKLITTPPAWLARFGRTVAEQVLDAVEDRLRASPRAGVEAALAGEALPSWDGGGSRPGGRDRPGSGEEARDAAALAKAEGAEAQAGLAALTDWLPGDRRDDPGSWSGAGSDDGRRATLRSRAVTGRDFLTGTSFALTAEAAGGAGLVSLWGRGALTRFGGRARGPGGDLRLEGEVGSAMLGADWTGGAGSRPGGRDRPGSGAGAWTAGLLLAHSRGEGSYRGAVDGGSTGGTVSSSVTGLYPYGRYRVTDRVTLWGVAGYGAGMLTLTPEDGDGKAVAPLRTDMELMMAALGVRGVAVEAPSEGGFELAGTSDAMVVRTSSEKTSGLEAATAEVTRVRLGLEGSWRGLAFGGHELTPSLEVGIRHDDGDAETGFGADIGPGLAWSHAKSGVSAEVSARGLLTHAAGGFREQGIAGSFSWKPRQGSDRGPSLTLSQTLGGSSQGGMDALLGRETLAGLAADDNGEDGLGNRRLDLRLGYGFSAIGDRFTSTPELGLGLSNGRREMSLGWRLNMDRSGASSLELRLEATRRESANDNAEAENGIGFRLTARW